MSQHLYSILRRSIQQKQNQCRRIGLGFKYFSSSLSNIPDNNNVTSSSSSVLLDQQQQQQQQQQNPLQKVLIANRGEIACRIIRTCQKLDIPTVALYSVQDGPQSLHAQMADESYCIGTGPSVTDSYLLASDILELAQETKATAIHPGYGFLSEDADFCQAVHDTPGITFIGPSPHAIQAMGSKSHSKQIMEQAGIPTTPGYYGMHAVADQSPQHLLHQAVTNVGFPLLIKAVLGGGGKGMRLVWTSNDFLSSLESCQREAMASFGNDAVLLEQYLLHPRHVEVQIVADQHGNVVHLYERDCSLQRRHQKIIEEAPASDLDLRVRQQLWECGIQAAKAVNYESAGTVEFLLDTTTQNKDDDNSPNFYFCEMNTRLQVEHPITEMITGLDLVEWQLRIAAGEPLLSQDEITCTGHALEARIYAETPHNHFLPATGTIVYHEPPIMNGSSSNTAENDATTTTTTTTTNNNSGGTVRVDTGIAINDGDSQQQQQQEISVYYDPMISKLTVHHPSSDNRSMALQTLVKALKQYKLVGVPTNLDFLIHCAQHSVFGIPGACHTGFLEEYMDGILNDMKKKNNAMSCSRPLLMYAASLVGQMLHAEGRYQNDDNDSTTTTTTIAGGNPWSTTGSGSWRAGGLASRRHSVVQVMMEEEEENETTTTNITLECWSNVDGSYDITVKRKNNKKNKNDKEEIEEKDDDEQEEEEEESFHIAGTLTTKKKKGTKNTFTTKNAATTLSLLVNQSKRLSFHSFLQRKEGVSDTIFLWSNNNNNDTMDDWYFGKVQFPDPYTTMIGDPNESSSSSMKGGDETTTTTTTIAAPMPGKITRMNVQVGDLIHCGDVIVVMEAMKMEHSICAPTTNDDDDEMMMMMVKEIFVDREDIVNDGTILVSFETTTTNTTTTNTTTTVVDEKLEDDCVV